MRVKVCYFAVLREQRGLSREEVEANAATPGALYSELRTRHAFSLEPGLVRAAVNGEFVEMDARLEDGDEVVFIPPVAGG